MLDGLSECASSLLANTLVPAVKSQAQFADMGIIGRHTYIMGPPRDESPSKIVVANKFDEDQSLDKNLDSIYIN